MRRYAVSLLLGVANVGFVWWNLSRGSWPLALINVAGVGLAVSALRNVASIARMERWRPSHSELVEGFVESLETGERKPVAVEFWCDGLAAGVRDPSGDHATLVPPMSKLCVTAPGWFLPYVEAMPIIDDGPQWGDG